MYNRILIANRGEIALRIIRGCRELGIETVAIYSEADRGAAYLDLADEAYCVGPAKSSQSYLKIAHVISALAATTSNRLRTSVLETTVVYVLPGIARCANTTRSISRPVPA